MLVQDGLDLGRVPLIHLSTVTEDWAAWAEAVDLPDREFDRRLTVDTSVMAIAAAIAGIGVAIGRRPLVDSQLAAGVSPGQK